MDETDTPQVIVERAFHDAITALDAVLALDDNRATSKLVPLHEGDAIAIRCRIERIINRIYHGARQVA